MLLGDKRKKNQSTMSEVSNAFEQFRLAGPILFALVDRARQDLVVQLAGAGDKGVNVTTLAEDSHLSRPAISHHLKVLKDAGIVSTHKEGTQIFYKLDIKDKAVKLKNLTKALETLIRQADILEDRSGDPVTGD